MNWQNSNFLHEEENQRQEPKNNIGLLEREQLKAIQLEKFQDPNKDAERQKYIHLANEFGDLLVQNSHDKIAKSLLSEDCEIFVFNSTGRTPLGYSTSPEGFVNLYKNKKIQARRVRETYVDVQKQTVFQTCNCGVLYEDDKTVAEEVSFEIFTIRNLKISKYRASFAHILSSHGIEDPLEPSIKAKKLAKVKSINFALCGQPDFEKVASLLHESTEYKILSWKPQKCFIFTKQDFAKGFQNLGEDLKLKRIVPYELYCNEDLVVGTYAYHLEQKSSHSGSGNKYIWLNTCIYAFDEELNIKKVIQQGEFNNEQDAMIPFEVYSREKIEQRVKDFFSNLKPNLDVFYSDNVQYDAVIYRLGRSNDPNSRAFQGIEKIGDLLQTLSGLEWLRPVDIFVDQQHSSYDIAIVLIGAQGVIYHDHQKPVNGNFLNLTQMAFENGKVSKITQFFSEILEPIPSPFDDEIFSGMNFRSKQDFTKFKS